MNTQKVIETGVAVVASDYIYDKNMDLVKAGAVAIADSVVEPMVSGSMQFVDPNQKLLLKGLVTSATLMAYDYLQGGTYNYMQYLKKGFTAQGLLYVYQMKK